MTAHETDQLIDRLEIVLSYLQAKAFCDDYAKVVADPVEEAIQFIKHNRSDEHNAQIRQEETGSIPEDLH